MALNPLVWFRPKFSDRSPLFVKTKLVLLLLPLSNILAVLILCPLEAAIISNRTWLSEDIKSYLMFNIGSCSTISLVFSILNLYGVVRENFRTCICSSLLSLVSILSLGLMVENVVWSLWKLPFDALISFFVLIFAFYVSFSNTVRPCARLPVTQLDSISRSVSRSIP